MLIPNKYYTNKTEGENVKKCMLCGCNFEIPDDDKNNYETKINDSEVGYVCEECSSKLDQLQAISASVEMRSDDNKDTTMVISQALGD